MFEFSVNSIEVFTIAASSSIPLFFKQTIGEQTTQLNATQLQLDGTILGFKINFFAIHIVHAKLNKLWYYLTDEFNWNIERYTADMYLIVICLIFVTNFNGLLYALYWNQRRWSSKLGKAVVLSKCQIIAMFQIS